MASNRSRKSLPAIHESTIESQTQPENDTIKHKSSVVFDKQVLICTNVLPILLSKNSRGQWKVEWDEGNLMEEGALYVQMNNAFEDGMKVVHIGVPPIFVPENAREEVSALLRDINCYPVYLGRERAHNHFQGYCKGVLFPIMHNVLDICNQGGDSAVKLIEKGADHSYRLIEPKKGLEKHSSSDDRWMQPEQYQTVVAEDSWMDYCAVNRQFASTVVEAYRENDIVWVQDYHLLLLPSFVRRCLSRANIGIYLHTPFPSSEIFRTLSSREDIIKAMLSSDHIGFQLFEYARHFLTCCNRMFGLKYEAAKGGTLRVPYGERAVMVTCAYVTPDPACVRKVLETSDLAKESQRERARQDLLAPGTKLIVSIDQVDSLRGLSVKLLALDKFMTMFPHLRNSVTLKQIGLKLDSRPLDFRHCHEEVLRLTEGINRKWGRTVIEYEMREDIPIRDRVALYQRGDILLSTVFRQALSTSPFEYLLARGHNPGVLLLSEFSACSRVLSGALRFNPMRMQDVAEAIETAMTMSRPERIARRARDLPTLESCSVPRWAKTVTQDIQAATTKGEAVMTFGFGFDYRFKAAVTSTAQLSGPAVAAAYRRARHRLLVLDYSGTLVETSSIDVYLKAGGGARTWHYTDAGDSQGQKRRPGGCLETRDPISDATRSVLKQLAANPHNVVAVVSNDLRDELAMALAGIPNLVLIAENGFVARRNPPPKHFPPKADHLAQIPTAEWQSVLDDSGAADWYGGGMDLEEVADTSWQVDVERRMEAYAGRTNGSFIWKAPSAVSFNHVLADPELGSLQSKNLVSELEKLLAGLPLIIEQGKGFVTVRLRGVNRGAMLRQMFKTMPALDFVLCCGDDTEDDLAFKAVNEYREARAGAVSVFNCRIGTGAKAAAFRLDEPADLHDLLRELAQDDGRGAGAMSRSVSAGVLDYSGFVTKESLIAHADAHRARFPRLGANRAPAETARAKAPLDSGPGTHALLSSKKDPQKRSILSLVGLADTNNMEELRTGRKLASPKAAGPSPKALPGQEPARPKREGKTQKTRRENRKSEGGESHWLPYTIAAVAVASSLYMWTTGRRRRRR